MNYYVKGLKWFDKVNGNTYHNAIIYNSKMQFVAASGLKYGYGTQYLSTARDLLTSMKRKNFKLYDMGSHYTKKANAKAGAN